MDTIWQDLKFGVRLMFKDRGFLIVAVLSLGLGIGVNTSVFSLANGLLFKTIAAKQPEQLVRLYSAEKDGSLTGQVSYPDYVDYGNGNQVFSDLIAVSQASVVLGEPQNNQQVLIEVVSGNFFSGLGVPASRGRTFLPADAESGEAPVAVLSDRVWHSQFGAAPEIVGQSVRINSRVFTVIGIAGKDFNGTFSGAQVDAWVPLLQSGDMLGPAWRGARERAFLRLIGRLKPGITLGQAQTNLNGLFAQLKESYPQISRGVSVQLQPATLLQGNLRQSAQVFLIAALAMVSLVLLIACVNLANFTVGTRDS